VGLGLLKPSRGQASSPQAGDEVLCDLDALLDSRAVFNFRGKTHVLLPISTERFFAFWAAQKEFETQPQRDPKEMNVAYLKLIKTVCNTIELRDVEAMTVVQKGALMRHIVAKIVGNKNILEDAEKKK
jgi:hypothetical protein